MKFRLFVAAALVVAACLPAGAQSVSGLSVKRRVADVQTEVDARKAALEEKERRRQELLQELEAARTDDERKAIKAKIAALDEEPISLAVPAGATAAVGDDKTAAGGPVFGFQAWRPDDFFAGAFFTFDTAATLDGDARKAGEFLRNPPAQGTSFYASASKMFWAFNRTTLPHRWSRAQAHRGDQLVFVGGALRVGVTNATLQRKEGEDIISKEAFVFHITPAVLLTSRTFKGENNGEYQFGMELGTTARWVGGDAAQDAEFRAQPDIFGHDDTKFVGFEGTIFVRLNAFQPFVRITRFTKRDGAHVPALTGAQAYFGVNVLSALFQTTQEAAFIRR